MLSCYTVDIASDSDDIHPPTICNGCYARMSRLSVSRGKNHYTPAEGIVTVWSPHTDSCFVCHAKSGVGRPAKSTKNRGRPPGETTNTIIAHIRVSAAPSVAMSVDTARICSSQVNPSHLTCAMCQCIADAPVALACGPLACCKCLIELLLSDGPATHCPGCNTDLSSNHIEKCTDMAMYRDTFPAATVTPKFHMLEDHVVPFLRLWRVGFGFHGEQGAESLHATFNKITRSYLAIPDRVQRLKCVLKKQSPPSISNIGSQGAPCQEKKIYLAAHLPDLYTKYSYMQRCP